ncbi:MAG: TolC family protein [Peptostreptococcaceae bacterium]|nr:TolC family protein [Peptostreptococcaceae bacterium]
MKYIHNIIKIFISGMTLVALAVLSNPVSAQTAQPLKLSLSQAIHFAINNEPLIKEAEDQVAIAKSKADEMNSSFLPHAAVSLNYDLIGPTPYLQVPLLSDGKFYMATPNNFNEYLGVNYLIYDFDQRKETLKLLQSNEVTESEKINLIRNQLAYQTAEVYFSMLYLQKSVDVMDQQIEDLEEHLSVARKMIATGSAIGLDTLNTSVRLTALQNDKMNVINQRKKAAVLLGSLMNFPKEKKFHVDGNLEEPAIRYSLDSLINSAYMQREELKLNKLYTRTASLNKAVIEKSNMPVLSFNSSFGVKNGYPDNLTRIRANYVLGLTANIPVFDGFLRKSKLTTADWQIQSTVDHATVLEQKISTEVERALLDYRNNKVQLKTALEEISLAQAAIDQAKGLYQSGSITNTTLLDTETALARAKLKYSYQLFQLTLSHYKLLQAEGEKIW